MARRFEFKAFVIVDTLGDEHTAGDAEDEAQTFCNEVNKGDGPHVYLSTEPPNITTEED